MKGGYMSIKATLVHNLIAWTVHVCVHMINHFYTRWRLQNVCWWTELSAATVDVGLHAGVRSARMVAAPALSSRTMYQRFKRPQQTHYSTTQGDMESRCDCSHSSKVPLLTMRHLSRFISCCPSQLLVKGIVILCWTNEKKERIILSACCAKHERRTVSFLSLSKKNRLWKSFSCIFLAAMQKHKLKEPVFKISKAYNVDNFTSLCIAFLFGGPLSAVIQATHPHEWNLSGGFGTFASRHKHFLGTAIDASFVTKRAACYARAGPRKCPALEKCIEFMKGTVISTARPGKNDKKAPLKTATRELLIEVSIDSFPWWTNST